MTVTVVNAQRTAPVPTARLARLARQALHRLGIAKRGAFEITFLDARRMRQLNRRFLRHDRTTDVLCFRYDGEPVVGEMFVAPSVARAYARRHGLSYQQELARYVIHGLLHWTGLNDRTPTQQRMMRGREDRLLERCRVR